MIGSAEKEHRYSVEVEWTGNSGTGTSSYRNYERRHEIRAPGAPKPAIPGSSDPAFRGDASRWNPEELLVVALGTCHMLWYLHLCSDAGLAVSAYVDRAEGVMSEEADGSGRFRRVVLRPIVTFPPHVDLERARSLHDEAHRFCFIASSVSFPVEHEPEFRTE